MLEMGRVVALFMSDLFGNVRFRSLRDDLSLNDKVIQSWSACIDARRAGRIYLPHGRRD